MGKKESGSLFPLFIFEQKFHFTHLLSASISLSFLQLSAHVYYWMPFFIIYILSVDCCRWCQFELYQLQNVWDVAQCL